MIICKDNGFLTMRIPTYLKKGDTIGILSTARKMTEEQLAFAINLIQSWGFEVKLGESIGAEEHQFAGNDEIRRKNLQNFMDDPSIDAILCARGGYGTMRIIDQLDFTTFLENPKWVCGFSDVTVLHEHLQSLGVASLHTAMPSLFPSIEDHATLNSIREALTGEKLTYTWEPNTPSIFPQNCKGEIVGGNLSLIYALQGSVSDINTDGKILFIEDLDEYFYHIDRMMCSLDRSGKLKNLKALLVGGMNDMKDNSIPFGMHTEEIILYYTRKYGYPIFFDFPCGHIEHNYAVKLGMDAEIIVEGNLLKFIQ
ncbi:MAG: LD-carboxypeptidase [Sphingobacteriales bacterium]|nr:LD-carboxypeptidase [Sphingobacteriales bacterium]